MLNGIKLTVAVPVFNMAPYLEETLICIENQTIGMKNMEVILINDGSTDASDSICRGFQKKHEENVRYVAFLENQGVSFAKNVALDMAKGSYITFWDADDLWSLNAMEEAVAFLESHEAEIDMVSCNIEYFDSYTRTHVLNFDVWENMIIDIKKEYRKIRTSGSACVLRTKAARKFRFNESQARWEDANYINQVLLQKKKYGMLTNIKFYYRCRRSNDSATQSHYSDKQYYIHDLWAFFDGVYVESLKQCGEFIPMMQYLLAYALGYFFSETADILNEEEHHQYNEMRKKILSYIDDCYLKEIPNADSIIKWKMLSFKYGLELDGEIEQWRQKQQQVQWNLAYVSRVTTNYNILKRWFSLKQQGYSLLSYFEKNNYFRIAVYGMSDLGRYLLKELEGSHIQVAYGIDRRAEKLEIGLPILTAEDTLPPVDAVIVTAVHFFGEIDSLLRQKVECPVISLEDVLYTIE